MKVCTDACIFGSWIAKILTEQNQQILNALDIGTGTGLLSLMPAQKTTLKIDAIEVEENAFNQAKENFKNSPWKERLHIFHADVKQFDPSKKYDLIISNPPFFENDLLSHHQHKNIAKHSESLTLQELIQIVNQHLSINGYFAVLLPYHRIEYFKNLAEENNFFLKEELLIKQTPAHNFFRGALIFIRSKSEKATHQLTIKSSEGEYTPEFKGLLKDYYLHL